MEFVRSLVSSEVAVTPVPALSDNYMYLVVDKATNKAAVVDPVEPEKILGVAKDQGVEVVMVLTTHNHWDHAGGNNKLVGMVSNVRVYGGKGDAAQGVTHEVGEGDVIELGALKIRVLYTPCHTPGHVCFYVVPSDGPGCVFTGDTLFVAGCGNFNAGTPKMMHDAFHKLGALPRDTLVWVGHEYTTGNLQYAKYVEPNNPVIASKLAWAKAHTAKGLFTVPSTMGEEQDTNPFLRAVVGQPDVLAHCGIKDPVDAMRFVREEKSNGGWKAKA